MPRSISRDKSVETVFCIAHAAFDQYELAQRKLTSLIVEKYPFELKGLSKALSNVEEKHERMMSKLKRERKTTLCLHEEEENAQLTL